MAQETEQLELSHENIVTFISENIPDCKDVTIGKLKSPTSELVQTVYCKILLEFGFSESIINLQQAEFDLLDEVGEYIDLYKTMLPVISLKVACVNLLTLINGDTTFGISDLLDPHPKRTQRFLSCLVNFWTFCNTTYEHVNKVSEDVEQVVAFKKNLEQRNEDYRNKINSYKHKAAEEAEATRLAQEDIDQLQMKTAQLMEYKETIDSINQKLKKDLEEESIATAAIEAEITKLETERDNVQGAVNFDAARERLDVELATLKEEVNLKVQMKIDRNSKISQLDQTSNILKSILEVAHLYSNEQQHIRDFNGKIQEINAKIETMNVDIDENGSMFREEDGLVKEKIEILNKMKNQWSRRRLGKQEDLEGELGELEQAKSSFDDDHLKAIECSNKVRETNQDCLDEQQSLTLESNQVRSQYTLILESIDKFNKKMAADMERLNNVKSKLSNCAGAL